MTVPDSIEVLVGATTDQGRVRTNNEDGFLIRPPVYAVADGMGGLNAGEVASAIALETLGTVADLSDGKVALSEWIRRANHAVFERAHQGENTSGMGTTLVAVVPDGDQLRLAHVGDSRAYMLRDGLLLQLTEDHSKVNRMVKEGLLTREEAEQHPARNVITRALGIQESVQCDETTLEVRQGDRLVLCTDGLSGMVDADAIRSVLLTEKDPQEASVLLVQAANAAGGEDNVTALVLDITQVTSSAASPPPSTAAASGNRRIAWIGVAVLASALLVGAIALISPQGGEDATSSPGSESTPPTVSPTAPPIGTVTMSEFETSKSLRRAAIELDRLLPEMSADDPFPSISSALSDPNANPSKQGRELEGAIPTEFDLNQLAESQLSDASLRYRSELAKSLTRSVDQLKGVFEDYRKLASDMQGLLPTLSAVTRRLEDNAEAFVQAYEAFWDVLLRQHVLAKDVLPSPQESQQSSPPSATPTAPDAGAGGTS